MAATLSIRLRTIQLRILFLAHARSMLLHRCGVHTILIILKMIQIPERRRINKDVHDGSQEYLQRPAATFTLQTSPRPCVLINHQYEVVFANQAAADVFEVSVNDLIGYELKSPTSHSAGSDQLAVSQPNAKGFIAELQAWWEGAQCLHNGGSELLRDTVSKKCFAWTCTSFEDERGKRLTQFVGLGENDRLLESFKPSFGWVCAQEVRDYFCKLDSHRYSLKRLLSIIGPSAKTSLAMQQTKLAIGTMSPVLIVGPNGSGKHRLAEAILSQRHKDSKADPPTLINCKVLDQTLLTEVIEMLAAKGRSAKENHQPAPSVLLDRIDLLPRECSKKMERFLNASTDYSVVGTCNAFEHPLDLHLQSIVDWLSVIRIELSALKDRPADLPVLINQVLASSFQSASEHVPVLSDAARDMLMNYSWPNGIGELVASLSKAVEAAGHQEIQSEHLPLAVRTFPSSALEHSVAPINLEEYLSTVERHLILQAMQLHPRNRSSAAKMLGISRQKLLRRIEQLGIEPLHESIETLEEDSVAKTTGAEADSSAAQLPDHAKNQPRRRRSLSDQELIELTTEEPDELPVFREIDDE